jgi:hypothetical protein
MPKKYKLLSADVEKISITFKELRVKFCAYCVGSSS